MKRRTRDGILIDTVDGQDQFLAKLYGNKFGRMLLKPLTRPFVSKLVGIFMSSCLSRFMIKSFIKKHQIDMDCFEKVKYRSYNDFFCRKIKPECRPVDENPNHFISPCDSKLTVLPITEQTQFVLKHTPYTVASVLKNETLAQRFTGGYAMIFRLTVDDYHRYCYTVDGPSDAPVKIKGILHTVNPIANDFCPIYKENSREYTLIHSENYGDMIVMEVGALLVGKIVNHPCEKAIRGQEKGYFQFGGSTVVVLTQENVVNIDTDILQNSQEGIETVVHYGEKIGTRA